MLTHTLSLTNSPPRESTTNSQSPFYAMERLMHFVWHHRLGLRGDLHTVDGRRVRVLDQGTLNNDAGPDFFNASIEIDGQCWAGNVEMHVRASDWYKRKVYTGIEARELMVPIFQSGELVYQVPDLQSSRAYCQRQVDALWDEVKRFENPHNYYVDLSQKLWEIKQSLLNSHEVK